MRGDKGCLSGLIHSATEKRTCGRIRRQSSTLISPLSEAAETVSRDSAAQIEYPGERGRHDEYSCDPSNYRKAPELERQVNSECKRLGEC